MSRIALIKSLIITQPTFPARALLNYGSARGWLNRARRNFIFNRMPRAPRRSRRQKKALVDWISAFDIMLNQGYFRLGDLVALYQTNKVVQTLFATFSLRLSVQRNLYKNFHVSDNWTWRKIFKAYKTQQVLGKLRQWFHTSEHSWLISALVIYGHVDLAADIYKRFGLAFENHNLCDAILMNGSKAVYDQCLQKFDCLDRNWLELERIDSFPPVPLFSLDLAETAKIWEWFTDESMIFNRSLAEFILDIGQLRSAVALDFLVSSLDKSVFSELVTKVTLKDVLLHSRAEKQFWILKKNARTRFAQNI